MKTKKKLHIFTSGFIQNAPEIAEVLNQVFESILSAEELGLKKSDVFTYKKINEMLAKNPEELVFIDDTAENIEAAKRAGWNGIVYLSNNQLFKELTVLEK